MVTRRVMGRNQGSDTAASDVSAYSMTCASKDFAATPWLQPASAGNKLQYLKQAGDLQLGRMGQLKQALSSAKHTSERQEKYVASTSRKNIAREGDKFMLTGTTPSSRRCLETAVNLVPPMASAPWVPTTTTPRKKRLMNKRFQSYCYKRLTEQQPNVPQVQELDDRVLDIPLPKWVIASTREGLLMKPPGLGDPEPSRAKLTEDLLSIVLADEETLTQTESPYSSEASDQATVADQWDSQEGQTLGAYGFVPDELTGMHHDRYPFYYEENTQMTGMLTMSL